MVQFPARVFVWREKLGLPSCPYLIRWVLDLKLLSIRLHHWLGSDDARNFHDHPWNFITIVFAGSYDDVSPKGRETLSPGSIRFRKAEHCHTVEVGPQGCWSLLLTGPKLRIWGFWVDGKFRRCEKYFKKFGHHPCQ